MPYLPIIDSFDNEDDRALVQALSDWLYTYGDNPSLEVILRIVREQGWLPRDEAKDAHEEMSEAEHLKLLESQVVSIRQRMMIEGMNNLNESIAEATEEIKDFSKAIDAGLKRLWVDRRKDS